MSPCWHEWLPRDKFISPKQSAVKGLIAVSCGTPSARLEAEESSWFPLGKKVAVTNLCQKNNGIPWGWCADVCQATKYWVGSTIELKEAQDFSPAGWLDESPSSEMHEQARLSGVIGRMKGGLM